MAKPLKRSRQDTSTAVAWYPNADVKKRPSPKDTPETQAEKDRLIAEFLKGRNAKP